MKMNINQMLIFPGLYFNKHLGAVNGFVAAGSSVFTFLLSFINPLILNDHGVKTNETRLPASMSSSIGPKSCFLFFHPKVKVQERGKGGSRGVI